MEVELDTNITPELFAEGVMNEFQHILASLLKESNISINEENIPRKLVLEAIKKTREVVVKDYVRFVER